MQHPEHISFLLGSRKQTELSFPLAPILRNQRCSVLNSLVSAGGRSPSLLCITMPVENHIGIERFGMQDHSPLLIKAALSFCLLLFAYLIATLT